MKSIKQLLDRFKNDLELMKQIQLPDVTVRLDEDDLKSLLYHLGELKAIHEKRGESNADSN